MRLARGFTLIELLVVVTIIIVLIALLTPAMDRAIYQAELAVCGSRHHALAAAATVYAHDNRRFYPSRPANYAWDALFLTYPAKNKPYETRDDGASESFDLRFLFRPYIKLDTFLDPLAGNISLEDADNNTNGATGIRGEVFIYSNVFVYTGWALRKTGYYDNRRLVKLGDRWTFKDGLHSATQVERKFAVLSADYNDNFGFQTAHSSHPGNGADKDFSFFRSQASDTTPEAQQDGLEGVLGGKFVATISYWKRPGGYNGETVFSDFNYAYTDGSVQRENQVRYLDERMTNVVSTSWREYYQNGRYQQLPAAGS